MNFPVRPPDTFAPAPTAASSSSSARSSAPIDDVWASLTEPERFARWYGSMKGEPGPGRTITVAMTAEKEVVEEAARILECAPPHRFVVELGGQQPPWHVSVTLREEGGVTTLTFVQRLTDDIDATDVGPGWEYYADRLAASRDGGTMPDWDSDGYQAALGPHYGAVH